MAYELKWTKRASDQLDAIERYITTDNPPAARREVLRVVEGAEILKDFPELGQIYRRPPEAIYREIVVRNYRIFYIIKPAFQMIDIVTVWHGARGEPELA
jgi:plasmid stabilization system protein ParE